MYKEFLYTATTAALIKTEQNIHTGSSQKKTYGIYS